MSTRKIVAGLAASLALLLASCVDSTCDPGQVFDQGVCVPEAPVVSCDAPADAGVPAPGTFGATCSGEGDCTAPSNYCAIQPGQSSGFCTRTGCVDDPTICPACWSCLDLSIFMAGLPAICNRP